MEEIIKELNLLLILLTGWEEDSRKNPGEKVFRACQANALVFPENIQPRILTIRG